MLRWQRDRGSVLPGGPGGRLLTEYPLTEEGIAKVPKDVTTMPGHIP
jgi:hypothetical protein